MTSEANVQQWLTYAEADLSAAEHLLDSNDFMACAFHCQQAIEKLLKAIIVTETQKRPPYLHNLRLLLEHISTIEVPADMASKAIQIEPHYIGTRYPGVVDPEVYNRKNMEELFSDTLEVYQWFLTKLGEMNKSDDS